MNILPGRRHFVKPGGNNLCIASIAAQSLCLPLAVYNYGTIPGLAIIANLLVSPLIAPTMLLTFLVGLTTFAPLVWPTQALLKVQIAIVNHLADVPWGSVEIGENNPLVFLVWPIIIAVAILMFRLTQHSYRPVYALEKSPKNGKI